MKIIEAMKGLKLIEKKIDANIEKIGQYSSTVSTERPAFGDEKAQEKEVASLVQANTDLVKEYLKTKRTIELTNLKVTADFGGQTYTLSDLLVLKRRLGDKLLATYNALNTKYADARVRVAQKEADGTPGKVLRHYDEKKKNENLEWLLNMMSNIDARLEVINATTDVVEE